MTVPPGGGSVRRGLRPVLWYARSIDPWRACAHRG